MSRFAFVVPPLAGHINPTIGVGAELSARGHEVAWVGHPAALELLLADGACILPVLDDGLTARLRDDQDRWLKLRGIPALRFFWEDFLLPLAGKMLPGISAAITDYAPDVVIADQQALAGAVAARRAGITWVTSASTSSELTQPLAAIPKVEKWIIAQLTAFQLDNGISNPVDLRLSDQLALIFTTPALMGDATHLGGQCVFTGPVLVGRPERATFPWEWLDPGRTHVLVSLGTINGPAGDRFFKIVVEALADLGDEMQLVVTAAQPESPRAGSTPPHILFAGHVPQLALLPQMSAVVCHGGHNTVCESLAHGLPLVVTPIRDDQPIIAQQVADAGAGIRLRFGRLRAGELHDAVRAVLDDPTYRTAAERVRDSFAAAGGAATAADHLEKLL